ncbi:uncharacterized protein EI97DRAFT_432215 [Westerdykella ornata]|uniref:Uncharacterized protein n=1 Tax=Westerdykella ornata TaxID=318751 RepID=A0A6A6JN31_WESOR|nr:uncharacterized protein EI97DRAFT_432215 [Westerdykella ornata]KAF2277338.1 hypothetical protein EI97DRAFT_432215 [Westerdykella ornata]
MKPSKEYERLSSSSDEDTISALKDEIAMLPLKSRRPPLRWFLWFLAVVALLVVFAGVQVAVFAILDSYRSGSSVHIHHEGPGSHSSASPSGGMHHHHDNAKSGGLASNSAFSPEILECGESAVEARVRGCLFDPMMQLWLPPACYNRENSEAYLYKNKWKWYADIQATIEIPDSVMRLGEQEVAFMDESYHRHHCIFTWENMVHALRNRLPMVEEMMSMEHVMHCHKVLLGPPWNTTKYPMATEAHSGFARCAPYEVWANNLPDDSDLKDVY